MSFVRYNPNPRGAITGDCVVRAITRAINSDWDTVYTGLCVLGFEMKDWGNSNQVWGAFLHRNGFTRGTLPDDCPDCYTVRDFCLDNTTGSFVLATGSHVVAVENGNYYDAWDSGNEVPAYYWRRKNDL